MERLYCPECGHYLEGGDGSMVDCHCGWRQERSIESNEDEIEQLRQRVAELEKEAKQLRDLQYELMRSGALVAIEKCKNATGQRRVIDMYVSANQIAEDLLNAMDSGA